MITFIVGAIGYCFIIKVTHMDVFNLVLEEILSLIAISLPVAVKPQPRFFFHG